MLSIFTRRSCAAARRSTRPRSSRRSTMPVTFELSQRSASGELAHRLGLVRVELAQRHDLRRRQLELRRDGHEPPLARGAMSSNMSAHASEAGDTRGRVLARHGTHHSTYLHKSLTTSTAYGTLGRMSTNHRGIVVEGLVRDVQRRHPRRRRDRPRGRGRRDLRLPRPQRRRQVDDRPHAHDAAAADRGPRDGGGLRRRHAGPRRAPAHRRGAPGGGARQLPHGPRAHGPAGRPHGLAQGRSPASRRPSCSSASASPRRPTARSAATRAA